MSDLELPEPKHREKIQAAAQQLFDALQGIVDSEEPLDPSYGDAVSVSLEAMERAKTLNENFTSTK